MIGDDYYYIAQKAQNSDKYDNIKDRRLAMMWAVGLFLASIICQIAVYLVAMFVSSTVFHISPTFTTEQVVLTSAFAAAMIIFDYRNVSEFYRGYVLEKRVDRLLADTQEKSLG